VVRVNLRSCQNWHHPNGFTAETVAALVIQVATQLSQPVSTTHVVSGAVMGSGATGRISAVRWGWRATWSSPGF
jgi:phosphate/sulfate permease